MSFDLPNPPSATSQQDFNAPSWQNWFYRLTLAVRDSAHLTGSAVIASFGTIAANGISSRTITVPKAVAGKPVILGAPATIEASLTWSGYVSAANIVTIRLHNTSGGNITPASNTWQVRVEI